MRQRQDVKPSCPCLIEKVISLNEYDIRIVPLTGASEKLNSLNIELGKVQAQFDSVINNLQSALQSERGKISSLSKSVGEASSNAGRMKQTLCSITEVYGKAEQTVFNNINDAGRANQKSPMQIKPPAATSPGVVFSSDLILPDWLQAAVIKFEQSR
jgi:hypothetical protein